MTSNEMFTRATIEQIKYVTSIIRLLLLLLLLLLTKTIWRVVGY